MADDENISFQRNFSMKKSLVGDSMKRITESLHADISMYPDIKASDYSFYNGNPIYQKDVSSVMSDSYFNMQGSQNNHSQQEN